MGALASKLARLSLNSGRVDTEKVTENFIYSDEQNLKTPKEKFIADQILDPRSATMGIRRTPLVLVKVGGETPVRPKAYLETDLDETCKGLDTSELDESEITEHHSLSSEEYLDDNNVDIPPKDIDFEESSPEKTNLLEINKDIFEGPMKDKVKRTFIYDENVSTPQSTPLKPKSGRTPLGIVSTNNSPMPSPLGKPWRGIREERIRLGLENTPPGQELFPDVVQSAPGKVGVKRMQKKALGRAHWALDESIVI